MEPRLEQYDVGVIVGRFQVHELHAAHRELIEFVIAKHEKVIIFLGLAPIFSINNPLDFEPRKQMLLAEYPQVNVAYIMDVNNDALWSKDLDKQINALVTPNQSVVLYGGRDSFIAHYEGKRPTQELTQSVFLSGTAQRKKIATSSTRATPDFRAGMVFASQARYPTSFQTVDVAILNEAHDKLLLAKRPTENAFRFVGGFVDPQLDRSLEGAAKREVTEETGLEVARVQYIGSTQVDDWRYRNERDKIMTALFVADHTFGRPAPADDLDGGELRWVDLPKPDPMELALPCEIFKGRGLLDMVVDTHRPLMEMLATYILDYKAIH